jgi:hypothetical protein
VLDAALHPAGNSRVFAADLHRAGSHKMPQPWLGKKPEPRLISRSSRFCFLKGVAGVFADIAVT